MRAPVPAFADPEAQAILSEICAKYDVSTDLLRDLADRVAGHTGSGRANGVMGDVEDVMSPWVDETDAEVA